jgi:hypothetical protein
LVYRAAHGPALALFANTTAGLSTPRTPPGAAYYLDQAYKAESVGALSAAATMFRAAVEHILYEQGFTRRMLGPKVEDLWKAIERHSAPEWARGLDPDELRVLKDLADFSVHPNEGDISKQAAFDPTLLAQVKGTVLDLLDVIYEARARRAERREFLRGVRDDLKKPTDAQ